MEYGQQIAAELIQAVPLYVPLGAVGAWRWSVWGIKKIIARLYKPDEGGYKASVSVVTPVYNEAPGVFRKALDSWARCGVDEIVAVIDYTDKKCIAVFGEFAENFGGANLIVTKKPGKRPALADGIKVARSEIVALVDSDTVWGAGVKEKSLAPFRREGVGGVTMRQKIVSPKTLAQRIFDLQQDLRFVDEYPFLTALDGSTVHCLSGRTAFYRRNILVSLADELDNETFWGKKVISGDDKWLTYLVEAGGWKVAYQKNAIVYTRGEPAMKTFLKQRLRWTRNSWRADLRALSQAWTWKKPYFALYLADRAIQPFALLMGPIYFIISLVLGLWIPAALLFVWWNVSRAVRSWSHLRARPGDVFILPAYVLFSFYFALARIYALATINHQGWITRWDKSRLPALRWLRLVPGYAITAVVLVMLTGTVFAYRNERLNVMGELLEEEIVGESEEDGGVEGYSVIYHEKGNAVVVTKNKKFGPVRIGLAQIGDEPGVETVVQTEPGVWELRSNVLVEEGVELDLERDGVKQIKLLETRAGRVRIARIRSF